MSSLFDADAYVLSIGQDVLDVFPNTLKSIKKLCDIDVLIMHSADKANCIILDKKDDGKFKDLSPKIFDTVYDDIIKAVSVNDGMPKKKGVTDTIKLVVKIEDPDVNKIKQIDVEVKFNVDDKTDALMQCYLYQKICM